MIEEKLLLTKNSNNILLKSNFIRSFGRVISRKLSDNKKNALLNLLPQYQIFKLSEISSNQRKFTKIILEIGFGFGDFIFENAKDNPDILFIGCEPHINGVVNLLLKLQIEPLKNIKIFLGDSRDFLSSDEEKIFDKIYVLFPDPWPKYKHYKRRLINSDFLKLLHFKAKTECILTIATDDDDYKKWIMVEYFKNGLWRWLADSKFDWQNLPEKWVKTKYQAKAELAGREMLLLNFLSRK